MPGGTRRPTRARACAGTAGDDPTTGGQSMPSTVTAGRDQSMSATRPEPSRSTPSSTCASARNCSAGYSTPGHVPVPSRPWIVVLPCASRRVASMLMSASSASGAGPPNMPECIGVPSVFTVTVTFASPRSAVVRVGTPTAKLPHVRHQDRVGLQQVSVGRDEGFQAAGALFLGALGDQLDPDGKVTIKSAQGGEMRDDVALAVGGAAPVPASVALGELEYRGFPCRAGGVQRRLHVVVAVQQDRGSAVGRRDVPEDGGMAVGRGFQPRVVQPGSREHVDHQLGGLEALRRGELPRVGHRLAGHERRQVGRGLEASACGCVRADLSLSS